MSGALSLPDLFDDIRRASWRGIPFDWPEAGDEVGRRIQRVFFPGLDTTAHQDMGALDGDIRVTGIIGGPDYRERAQLLREACRKAGPGTLVHPWWGEIKVVLAKPAAFDWSQAELGVVRFQALFQWWREAPAPQFDTLGLLLLAIEAQKEAVRAWLSELLAPVRLAFGLVNAVAGVGIWAAGSVTNLVGGLANGGPLLGQLAPNLAALGVLGGLPPDSSYGGAVADALAAPAATIAEATLPLPPAAIGAGGTAAAAPVVLDAAAVATALLAQTTAAPIGGTNAPAPVLLAAQLAALSGAVAAAARIPVESQQAALAWRQQLDDAIADRMAAVAAQAAQAPAQVAQVYRALGALRAALARDLAAEAGRLPAEQSITVPGECSVWAVANWLAGEHPERMAPLVADLVVRNGLRRPAIIPAGTVLRYLA